MKYISMKMLPKGRIPPSRMMVNGSMNHFFSGIGLGTAFTLTKEVPVFRIRIQLNPDPSNFFLHNLKKIYNYFIIIGTILSSKEVKKNIIILCVGR